MRISELKGIKNTEEYRVLKQSRYARDLEIKLNELGYEDYYLGSGIYGVVYARPQDNYVLKLFKSEHGYNSYIKFMKKHSDSPYVPKIKGRIIKLPNYFYLIKLERLNRVPYKIWKEIHSYMNEYASTEEIEEFDKKYPGLGKLIKQLKSYGKKHKVDLDLHDENIMMRGTTPVITDPFSA